MLVFEYVKAPWGALLFRTIGVHACMVMPSSQELVVSLLLEGLGEIGPCSYEDVLKWASEPYKYPKVFSNREDIENTLRYIVDQKYVEVVLLPVLGRSFLCQALSPSEEGASYLKDVRARMMTEFFPTQGGRD